MAWAAERGAMIHMRIYNADGTVRVSDKGVGVDRDSPHVAAMSDDRIAMAWRGSRNGVAGVVGAIVDGDGQTWRGPDLVSTEPDGDQDQISVAQRIEGELVFVWRRTNPNEGPYITRTDLFFNPIVPDFRVASVGTQNNTGTFGAALPNGRLAAMWIGRRADGLLQMWQRIHGSDFAALGVESVVAGADQALGDWAFSTYPPGQLMAAYFTQNDGMTHHVRVSSALPVWGSPEQAFEMQHLCHSGLQIEELEGDRYAVACQGCVDGAIRVWVRAYTP